VTRRVQRSRSTVASGWDAYGNPVPGDVLACLEEIGVEVLRVKGEEAEAKCPAHFERTGKEDQHPSFSVNLEEGIFGCFSCGFRGRFVALVAYVLGMTQAEATIWVRGRGGIERVRKILSKRSDGLLMDERDTSKHLNEASLALYTDVPEEAAAERNGITVESCNALGVRWDPEHDRWIVPIREAGTGKLMGWQEKNARYFRNKPLNVPKGKTLFGINEAEGDTLILVESPLDVVRLHAAGFDNGVSSFGAGVTDDQLSLIIDRAEVLIVALDNDKDGKKYSKMLKDMYAKRIIMRFFDYSQTEAKDPGDMTNEEIRYGVENAVSSVLVKF